MLRERERGGGNRGGDDCGSECGRGDRGSEREHEHDASGPGTGERGSGCGERAGYARGLEIEAVKLGHLSPSAQVLADVVGPAVLADERRLL